jgi:hypothetical protein
MLINAICDQAEYNGDEEGEAWTSKNQDVVFLDQETEACWLVSLTIFLSITLWQFTNSILV